MEITLMQAIFIGLIFALSLASDLWMTPEIARALIISTLVGAVLGNVKDAIIFGASAELLYLGLIAVAGVVAPHPVGPGIFGTIFYLQGNNLGTSLAFSMPFAIFVQFLLMGSYTLMSPTAKFAESLIKKEKWITYKFLSQGTIIIQMIFGFILGLAAGLGMESLNTLVAKIPDWFRNGLGVVGKMMPAIGFSIVLKVMLKREYVPFMFLGFILVIIFSAVGIAKPEWGFNLLAIALAATAVALIVYFSGMLTKKRKEEVKERVDGI